MPRKNTTDECLQFFRSLPLLPNFGVMVTALFRPLSCEVVETALDRHHNNVSPGHDGMQAKFYKDLNDVFVP